MGSPQLFKGLLCVTQRPSRLCLVAHAALPWGDPLPSPPQATRKHSQTSFTIRLGTTSQVAQYNPSGLAEAPRPISGLWAALPPRLYSERWLDGQGCLLPAESFRVTSFPSLVFVP